MSPLPGGGRRATRPSRATFPAINGVDLRPDIDAAERLAAEAAAGREDEVKSIAERLGALVV